MWSACRRGAVFPAFFAGEAGSGAACGDADCAIQTNSKLPDFALTHEDRKETTSQTTVKCAASTIARVNRSRAWRGGVCIPRCNLNTADSKSSAKLDRRELLRNDLNAGLAGG